MLLRTVAPPTSKLQIRPRASWMGMLMAGSAHPNSPELQKGSAGERLDSWKEIAAYLRRSVRTVHRWEAEQRLPVHRHLHQSSGTVYAIKSELDAWWGSRRI